MQNSLFYNHIEKNDLNKDILESIELFASENSNFQIYLITSPLGERYSYDYETNAIVILSPKHRLIFLDLKRDQDRFDEFYEDFIEDLSSISDKFEYKEHIGRPREWKRNNTTKEFFDDRTTINELFEKNFITDKQQQRVSELLISLLIGSINDIESVGADVPDTLLEKVKRNIVLFDGDQTRFIYKEFTSKSVAIQGLSGTGKTELLLHKLKELYLSSDSSKLFFTCHNIALANTLKDRIPSFFNFMKVEKQIEWNSRLWVDRAWGSKSDRNSGLYSYICHFYNIPFLRYGASTDYKKIFTAALEHINQIDVSDFRYAFDYILIDERQDFPNVFFELCEKIARHKVYIAGDIFQDIFENTNETELNVDVVLNRCYRTDPRTLMFAHAVGMGLFEKKKLNWFNDDYWGAMGYEINRLHEGEIHLYREPIRRFEDLELDDFPSTIIQNTTNVNDITEILKNIKSRHPNVKPDDVAIIILDDDKGIYGYIDALSFKINNDIGWGVNRAYENKTKIEGLLYVSNPNNVKGLEFPFVICITGSLKKSYRYRNILYTMLTRSFIQSYLLVTKNDGIEVMKEGLEVINKERYIKTIEPNDEEKEEIKNTLIRFRETRNISYKEFLDVIFDELKIEISDRKKFETLLMQTGIEKFDKDKTIKFIQMNKEFL